MRPSKIVPMMFLHLLLKLQLVFFCFHGLITTVCEHCGAKFSQRQHLHRHLRESCRYREEAVVYSCNHCNKEYSTASGLRKHLSKCSLNTLIERKVCSVCNKEVPIESFIKHQEAHSYDYSKPEPILPKDKFAPFEEGEEGTEARSLYPELSLRKLRELSGIALEAPVQNLIEGSEEFETLLKAKNETHFNEFNDLLNVMEKRFGQHEEPEEETEAFWNEEHETFSESDSSEAPSDSIPDESLSDEDEEEASNSEKENRWPEDFSPENLKSMIEPLPKKQKSIGMFTELEVPPSTPPANVDFNPMEDQIDDQPSSPIVSSPFFLLDQ